MSRTHYGAGDAAADLARAGLLSGVLSVQNGQLTRQGPEGWSELPGGFQGGGLDSRSLAQDQLFVALCGEQVDGRRFAGDALAAGHWVLMAPGEEALMTALCAGEAAPGSGVFLCEDPVRALACLGAAWRATLPVRIVGVTGTNGKTTTKDLLRAALSAGGSVHATAGNLNNRLGLPLTLLGLTADHTFAVIEMGASALGEIEFLSQLTRPEVGVITNAAPAHLAEFGSLAGIIQGKGELLDQLPPDGRAILNGDSPGFTAWRQRARCSVVSHGLTAGDHIWTWRPMSAGGQLTLDREDWTVPLPGIHNGANQVAAILAARALGLSETRIRDGLSTFRGSAHRGILLKAGAWTILDDSYNANPRSMAAAAAALVALPGQGQTVAVLGHMAEMGPQAEAHHLAVGQAVAQAGVDVLLAVGDAAAALAKGFLDSGGTAYCLADVEAAAHWLGQRAADVDRILVKGSRSAAMERILPLLTRGLNSAEDRP